MSTVPNAGSSGNPSNRVRIVVATSVMLSFISFWRAAAIVLNDLGSSAFYAGSIAEKAVGPSAPWFILGVMLFAYAVRAVYVESCSMFVRGGVYKVVKEAMGGFLAKISVSMLIFDYVLTGPISGVSAGHYIVGLINSTLALMAAHGWIPAAMHEWFGPSLHIPENTATVVFAVAVTLFYWWENTKGIEESSEKALRVMQITAVMVIILLLWSGLTLLLRGGAPLPPFPTPGNITLDRHALGWLEGGASTLGLFGILIAFGHSVLAMSGEEALAQVNREIAHPKLINLKRAAMIIAIFSFLFTGIGTLLASMLVPADQRLSVYSENLLSGLAMSLVGPVFLKLLFQGFVVICGFLILSGAINTSIIAANGVLNRVSEDGVLHDWFRKPQKKYGTTYRLINLIVVMQLATILFSWGDVFILGEAYAFGVIWSFTFNSLAMLMLRFKFQGHRGWKVPVNIRLFGTEIPLGLASVHFVLLATAIVNLFTKTIATKAGIVFAIAFFLIFTLSERANRQKHLANEQLLKEHFQLEQHDTINTEVAAVRPGNLLVTVRDYNTLTHLKWVLERTDTDDNDIVVMAVRMTGPGAAEYDLSMEQIFSDYERTLFSRALAVAESYGKTISLMVVPGREVFTAIVQAARQLDSSAIVAGLSSKMTAEEQSYRLGQAWEGLPEPKRQFLFQVVNPDMTVRTFRIGPHTPTMRPEDVHLVHRMWLRFRQKPGLEKLHHSEIITLSLTRLARDLGQQEEKDEILRELRRMVERQGLPPGAASPLAAPPRADGKPQELKPPALPPPRQQREASAAKDPSSSLPRNRREDDSDDPPLPPVVSPT